MSVLPTIIQQSFESISQAISHSEHALAETLGQINSKIETISGKTDTLATNIANLTTLCQNINATIASSTKNLTAIINNAKDEILKTIKESQKRITSSSNINRWIMIIGFIILVIINFVMK